MKVGQKVYAVKDIYEYPDGDSPGGYCCARGDELFIRAIHYGAQRWPYSVSHEGREGSFSVGADEIKEYHERP